MPFKDLLTVHRANRHEVQRLISGRKSALQESVKLSVSQGRLLLGHSKLLHSLCAAQENLYTVNQTKNISVARSFSRAIYIPSVPGPAFHVCDYLGRLISYPTHLSSGIESQRTPMAACGFRSSSLFECPSSKVSSSYFHEFHPGISVKTPLISNCSKGFENCRKVSMGLKKKNQPNSFTVYGYFAYVVAKRRGNAFPLEGFVLNSFHRLPHACFSTGTAPDVSLDKVSADQFANSADSKEEKVWIGRSLKLNSGSCYLPHPDKEETGGEDAHFICGDEQAIGVADGVGGWAELGVDAGQYARELMSNSVSAILEEPKGSIDPARVLEKAHMSTKAKGSSTACIIALTDQGLHAINLGDSGFMVVRDGCTVFRSPSQQHDFNFTFQLESGSDGDLPSSGQVFKVGVAPGDVIITGTDGLFDNLYNSDITSVVVHGARAGLGPQVIAQQIAALARQRARDQYRQTPFSSAALDAGFLYYGGKLDDITVVVSYVTTTTRDESESSSAPPCKST
ncbi:unnamed protein product [Cuscuta campestris]|uniref:Protein phosphatase n=1 Tax=Cuscuta campestris TaxID=132261 RepID=A0A484NDM0_9ASTE|nr:unnamed protein product [Cuscuta campestris]